MLAHVFPATGAERLRLQFAADDGSGPRFSVEASHENAARLPQPVQERLRLIAEDLRVKWGLQEATELTDFRTYWARNHALDQWTGNGETDVVEQLMQYVREDIKVLVESGIFRETDGLPELFVTTR